MSTFTIKDSSGKEIIKFDDSSPVGLVCTSVSAQLLAKGMNNKDVTTVLDKIKDIYNSKQYYFISSNGIKYTVDPKKSDDENFETIKQQIFSKYEAPNENYYQELDELLDCLDDKSYTKNKDYTMYRPRSPVTVTLSTTTNSPQKIEGLGDGYTPFPPTFTDYTQNLKNQISPVHGAASSASEAITGLNMRVRAGISNSIPIYKGPGDTSDTLGYMPGKAKDGSTPYYDVNKVQNGFYYIDELGGWVPVSCMESVRNLTPSLYMPPEKEDESALDILKTFVEDISDAQYKIYESYVNAEYNDVLGTGDVADSLLADNLNGIYGIPYQFPESVDPKLEGTAFGSIYAERIVTRMPLLMLSPGKVSYMTDFSTGEKRSVFDALLGAENADATLIGQFLSKPGRYYTFKYDAPTYWKYVNAMNRASAVYLGIQNVKVNINGYSQRLDEFRWEKATNSKFDSLLISNQEYVCFYADADSTVSNGFSNDTTSSQIADKVNSFSSLSREIQFLIGTQSGTNLDWLSADQIDEFLQSIEDSIDIADNDLIKNITKEFAVVASGGKLMFPEIWSDSQYSQTFDVKFKLRCPCPNKVSWFMDIQVPINHLLAFTMARSPRGTSGGGDKYEPTANGYVSPFLVRAFFRGLFSCDMGIITNLSLDKGKEGSWTLDGLPSEVDVSMEIKDLYNMMCMTASDQDVAFINNTTYLNYLATSCGICINKPDAERSIDLWLMLKKNYWKDKLTGYNWWQKAKQGTANKLYDLYRGIFKG